MLLIPVIIPKEVRNTGLSPAFQWEATWQSGWQRQIPIFFSSASEFCHSPGYYDVGDPAYMTTIDVQQLWRNLRGLPFRHSTNDRDYLRYYTSELYSACSGQVLRMNFILQTSASTMQQGLIYNLTSMSAIFLHQKKILPVFLISTSIPGLRYGATSYPVLKPAMAGFIFILWQKMALVFIPGNVFPGEKVFQTFDISLTTPSNLFSK